MASDTAKPGDEIEAPAVDIEAGVPPAALRNVEKVKDTPTMTNMHIEEPYMELSEIAALNVPSNINLSDIEQSGGLSSVEVTERVKLYGKNIFTPPKKMPEWKRFALQFKNMFMVLLYGCRFLSLIAFLLQLDKSDKTNLYLAIALFVVVILTCWMQFHEEGKAYKIMDSFTKMLAAACTVIRDGSTQQIPVEDLVIGDLVLIKDGDKVPADLVLLLCRGLKVECSSLTGESEPITCSAQVSSKETRIFECKNLAFSSSLCFDGMAIGIVVRTGDKTVCVGVCAYVSPFSFVYYCFH
jgi:sodium/potassium-transporting ATPase subunit alpha